MSFACRFKELSLICTDIAGAGVFGDEKLKGLPFVVDLSTMDASTRLKSHLPPKETLFHVVSSRCKDLIGLKYENAHEISQQMVHSLKELVFDAPFDKMAADWILWRPSDVLMEYIDLIDPPMEKVEMSHLKVEKLNILDLGSGNGRDLAWLQKRFLFHQKYLDGKTRKPIFHAVDHDCVSLENVKYRFSSYDYKDESCLHLHRSRILSNGVRNLKDNSVETFQDSALLARQTYNLVMCNRYLPPRESFPSILGSVSDGGYFLMSHFVDDGIEGTWYLSPTQETAKFSHPKTFKHILKRDEMSKLCLKYGFEIRIDTVRYLPDSRPLLWFLAQKQPSQISNLDVK